jgi:Zn-dependent protease with chaperone function
MTSPKKLTGLRVQAYEHPSDASTLNALKKTVGLDTVVQKLYAWGFERLLRVQLTGSYLRVTADSFPDLHELLNTACDILDLPSRPDLYIGGSGELNAFTAGVEHPLIMLYSGAVEALTQEELLFVIGHEVGHIKSAHVLYYQIAEFLPIIGEIVGRATLGVGELLGAGLQIALLRWKRMSELTADRAGLLACQDADVALRALMKLAGLPHRYFESVNTEDFIKQAHDFEAMDADKLTMLAKWLSTTGTTHPWTVMRAKELLQWVDSHDYEEVLKAPQRTQFRLPTGTSGYCTQCGNALQEANLFCPRCGRSTQAQAAGNP